MFRIVTFIILSVVSAQALFAGEPKRPGTIDINVEALLRLPVEERLVALQQLNEIAGQLADSFDPFEGKSGHEILAILQSWDDHPGRKEASKNHASILLVLCEDGRLDGSRVLRFPLGSGVAYTVRVAGGIPVGGQVKESIRLPFARALKDNPRVPDSVKLILFLSHSDCGQQKIFDKSQDDDKLASSFRRCTTCKLNVESIRNFVMSTQTLRNRAQQGSITIAYGHIATETLDWELIREFQSKEFEQ